MKLLDLAGERIGMLLVVERVNKQAHRTYWLCICRCGEKLVRTMWELRRSQKRESGLTGCRSCVGRVKSTKHGDAVDGQRSRLYDIWVNMRERCRNPKKHNWQNYGGKGIAVSDEWNSYPSFKEWAMSHGYADNLTIDRIDNNGDYEPVNCRWITLSENSSRSHLKIA